MSIQPNNSSQAGNRLLLQFLERFAVLQEEQIAEISQSLRDNATGVLQGITAINAKTEQKREEANTVLIKTYTQPDAATKASMDSVQDEVSALFEKAQAGELEDEPSVLTKDKTRRSAGLFSKHMEALETLDEEMKKILEPMLELIERNELLAQKLEHVSESWATLHQGLNRLRRPGQKADDTKSVDKFSRDLKNKILKSYTTEDERRIFNRVFPKPRKAS